jgi:hypothetical protein
VLLWTLAAVSSAPTRQGLVINPLGLLGHRLWRIIDDAPLDDARWHQLVRVAIAAVAGLAALALAALAAGSVFLQTPPVS